MSQSQSHRKQACERAVTHDSTSSSQHSQSIKDIKDDIGALEQDFSRLEKELNDSNDKYNSSVKNAEQAYGKAISKAYTDHLAKLYDLLEKSKAEDTKEQEYEESVSAVQKQIDEIKKRLAKEIEAKTPGNPASNAINAIKRVKANAIRKKPEEINKFNGTPEGTQAVEDSNARLTSAFKLFEIKVMDINKQYLKETGKIKEQQKEIKEILDEKNIPKVPGNCAEAAERVEKLGSQDPRKLLEKMERNNADHKRRKLL